jgi:hypothetical protein
MTGSSDFGGLVCPSVVPSLQDDKNSAAANANSRRVINVMAPGYPVGVFITVWPVETPTAY